MAERDRRHFESCGPGAVIIREIIENTQPVRRALDDQSFSAVRASAGVFLVLKQL